MRRSRATEELQALLIQETNRISGRSNRRIDVSVSLTTSIKGTGAFSLLSGATFSHLKEEPALSGELLDLESN